MLIQVNGSLCKIEFKSLKSSKRRVTRKIYVEKEIQCLMLIVNKKLVFLLLALQIKIFVVNHFQINHVLIK